MTSPCWPGFGLSCSPEPEWLSRDDWRRPSVMADHWQLHFSKVHLWRVGAIILHDISRPYARAPHPRQGCVPTGSGRRFLPQQARFGRPYS